MSADLLALLDKDPAAGILAVADLRERTMAASVAVLPGRWRVVWDNATEVFLVVYGSPEGGVTVCPGSDLSAPVAEHIAAEANPAHALAAVRRWRGVVERHKRGEHPFGRATIPFCVRCESLEYIWPCPDLTETVAEAKAYLGGAS